MVSPYLLYPSEYSKPPLKSTRNPLCPRTKNCQTIDLIVTDLPDPVAPATRKCGSASKSTTISSTSFLPIETKLSFSFITLSFQYKVTFFLSSSVFSSPVPPGITKTPGTVFKITSSFLLPCFISLIDIFKFVSISSFFFFHSENLTNPLNLYIS